MVEILIRLLEIYSYVIIASVLISWLRIQPGSTFYPVVEALHTVTDPVLGPIRKILPRTGMFDFSPMIVFFGIQILVGVLRGI